MNAEEPKDVARLRQAFASLEDEAGSARADSQRIFDALHGDMSSEERQAVVEELLTNPAAAHAWRLAREMGPDAAAVGAPREALSKSTHPTRWMSIAAAVLLAIGLGWQLMPSRGAAPAYRSVESRAIASRLDRGADLPRATPVLRWTGVDGARYRVRVLTSDLQVLDESAEVAATEYTISTETLGRIPPGGEIFWQIEARIPGEVVITSPTFNNRVP